MIARRLSLLLCASFVACGFDEAEPEPIFDDPDAPGIRTAPDFPVPTGPCALDPETPTRIVLTTTDFATGAVSVVDLADGTVTPDVAPGSTDALPIAAGDRLFVLHRFGLDFVHELDAGDFALLNEISLAPADGGSANPHALALAPDGRAFVVMFQRPEVVIFDPTAAPADAVVGTVDLAPAAFEDTNPDASSAVACGEHLFVVAEQLDDGFQPRGQDALLAIDMTSGTLVDTDLGTPGVQGLRTLGTWMRQLRRDPSDPTGMTLLGLSTGIERIDLSRGEVTWAVEASIFHAVGIDEFLRPQAFDVDANGEVAYLAAYADDFGQVRLYRVGLDGNEPMLPEPFAEGYDSVERTLEVVGDGLWYASTRADAPGVLRFDLLQDPPVADGPPRSTGLPPYGMTVLP